MNWSMIYRLRDAREGIARNAWASAAAAAIITLSLVIFGGFLWLNSGLAELASLLQQQVQIRAFVAENADAGELKKRVESVTGVQRVTVIPGERTYDRLADLFGSQADLRAAFPDNPFPDSLSVSVTDASYVDGAVQALRDMDDVEEVVWGQGLAEPLFRMAERVRQVGLILSVAFLGAALLVTTVAIHLTLLSRLNEIRIQRWMGVSPWGIRSQFMIEGFLLGLFSASLAAFSFVWLAEQVRALLISTLPLGGNFAPAGTVALLLAVTGPVLGLIGGLIASQRLVRGGESE